MDSTQDIINKAKYEYLKAGILQVLTDLQSRQEWHQNKGNHTKAKNAASSVLKVASYMGFVEQMITEKERPIIYELKQEVIRPESIPKLNQLKGNIKKKYAQLLSALCIQLNPNNQGQTKLMSSRSLAQRELLRMTSIQQAKQCLPHLF